MKFGYVLMLVVAVAAAQACAGCEEEPPKEDPKPIVKKIEEPPPKEDPLKEATENAEELSTANAVFISDRAREVAAEIEAASHRKKVIRTPKEKPEPETGTLAKAELRKVFNVHAGAMRKCYERQLKRNPRLEGKVRLEVLIRTDGTVRSANVKTVSLDNSQVSSCMERQARTMKFPKPDGGAARVSMPYTFTPEI